MSAPGVEAAEGLAADKMDPGDCPLIREGSEGTYRVNCEAEVWRIIDESRGP